MINLEIAKAVKEKIMITCVRNPWDPHNSRDTKFVPCRAGACVRDYAQDALACPDAGIDIAVSLDGMLLAEDEAASIVPLPGSNICFCAVPHGGGGDGGKDIGKTIASLAALVLASYVMFGTMGYLATGSWTTKFAFESLSLGQKLIGMAAGAGVNILGGALVNQLFPPSLPDLAVSDFAMSNTYSWDPPENSAQEGMAIPVLYGKMKIAPELIAWNINTVASVSHEAEKPHNPYNIQKYWDMVYARGFNADSGQTLNMLFGVTEALPDQGFEISDIKINDEILDNFEGADWGPKDPLENGCASPEIINMLDQPSVDQAVKERLITTDYVSARTVNSNCSKLFITIAFPFGNYAPGAWEGYVSIFHIQFKKAEDTKWRTLEDYYREIFPGLFVPRTQAAPVNSRDPYFLNYCIPNLEPAQYDVRIKLTKDNTLGNICYFDFLQEWIPVEIDYAFTSLLWIANLPLEQLNGGMPAVTCLAERKYVKITAVIAGAEETKLLPSNNPAWISYDILNNSCYGGGVPASRLIYSEFERWAAFCIEHGLYCSIYFDSAMSLERALLTVGAIGRGRVIQKGSKFYPVWDEPSGPVQLFSMGNIVEGGFSGSFMDLKDRANAIEISYWDKEYDYSRQQVEVRSIGYDTTEAEVVRTSLTLYGCVDKALAVKHGNYLLRCNKYLTRMASLEVDVDALASAINDVVWIQHDVPQWGFGGRVVSAAQNTVTIDRSVTLSPGVTYKIIVRDQQTDSLDERTIKAVLTQTQTDILEVTQDWSSIPQKFAVYTFGEENKTAKLFRIIDITRGQEQRRRLALIEYKEEISEDSGEIPEDIVESALNPVTNVSAVSLWRQLSDGSGVACIVVTWQGQALCWHVFIKESSEKTWRYLGYTTIPKYEIFDGIEFGKTYDISVSVTQNPAQGEQANETITGNIAMPSDVQGFSANQHLFIINFIWQDITDADTAGYEMRQGPRWDTGRIILYNHKSNTASWIPPRSGNYTFWLKAKNTSGLYSENPACVFIEYVMPPAETILNEEEFTKASPLDGVCDGFILKGTGFLYTVFKDYFLGADGIYHDVYMAERRLRSNLCLLETDGGASQGIQAHGGRAPYFAGNQKKEYYNPYDIAEDDDYLYIIENVPVQLPAINHLSSIIKKDKRSFGFIAKSALTYGDYDLQTLTSLCADGTHLFITNLYRDKVFKFLCSGLSIVSSIGGAGSGDDQFSNPEGIACDGTHIYVCDTGNHRIVKRLKSDLSYVSKAGSQGSGNDQFESPEGIAVDGVHVYVCDTGNHRIVKRLKSDLSYVSKIDINAPYLISADTDYLYVAADGYKRLIKYDKSTSLIVSEAVIGTDDSAVCNGIGLNDNSLTDCLVLISGLTDTDVSSETDVSDADLSNYAGTLNGTYTSAAIDLGGITPFVFRINPKTFSAAIADTEERFADRTDLENITDTDIAQTSLAALTTEIRFCVDIDNELWSDWQPFSGSFMGYGRYIQWRISSDIDAYKTNYIIMHIRYSIDVPEQQKRLYNETISSSGTTFALASLGLEFPNEYQVAVSVLGASAYFATVSKTSSQFTVYLFDKDGAAAGGAVDIFISGY